jgi:hypothetical protein
MKNTKLHLVYVLDYSGSMQGSGKTNLLESLKAQLNNHLKESPTGTTFSVYVFNEMHTGLISGRLEKWNIDNILNRLSLLNPNTGTNLYASVNNILDNEISAATYHKYQVTLLTLISDGQDTQYSFAPGFLDKLKTKIADLENEDWTFTAVGPNTTSYKRCVDTLGLHPGNCSYFNIACKEETAATTLSINTGFSAYTKEVARGNTKTRNYFTTDLSGVKTSDIKNNLTPLTSDYKVHEVKGENSLGKPWEVKEFVEQKGKLDFKTGQLYYQLVKKELVQAGKEILVMEKGKPTIWGGLEARSLLGFGTTDTMVEPGNHSKYDIFVQSTSHNRKLSRGTKVVINHGLKRSKKPTWSA